MTCPLSGTACTRRIWVWTCPMTRRAFFRIPNIGYFPSYAIGSAYGAQYLLEMQKDFDVFEAVRSGKLTKINGWMEEKIWKYGCMKDPTPLFESVCGKFDPTRYTAYLREKLTEVYGL